MSAPGGPTTTDVKGTIVPPLSPPASKSQLCKFHELGTCAADAKCPYAHGKDDLMTTTPTTTAERAAQLADMVRLHAAGKTVSDAIMALGFTVNVTGFTATLGTELYILCAAHRKLNLMIIDITKPAFPPNVVSAPSIPPLAAAVTVAAPTAAAAVVAAAATAAAATE